MKIFFKYFYYKKLFLINCSVLILIFACQPNVEKLHSTELIDEPNHLAKNFLNPPESTKPGVYWYFMDGNQNRDEMTSDLEAMASVGIGKVVFLEVNIGVPRGPVNFMSDQWQDNFVHAVKTTKRLGMELILGTGPGWAGSGGPWVKPEDSMQHLVGSTTEVSGPIKFKDKLGVPKPPKPNYFAGMSKQWEKVREEWYQDVSVLAFPTPKDIKIIDQIDLKSLKETQPYSIWKHVPRYVKSEATYKKLSKESVINFNEIIDITDNMNNDGTLEWDVPKGNWTIMRFVSRTTGQTTRPAPTPGHGYETDKFNPKSFEKHWENFQQKLLDRIGTRESGSSWTRIHLDSWEMSSQNWSQQFQEEFIQRRGYDPKPFYPAYSGMVVGSLEQTERFLWDLRKTSQELVIDNYVNVIKAKSHEHNMKYSNQPYDMNPAGNLDLGSVADIPSCEFWDYRNSNLVDSLYSCIEATSIAHTMGKSEVPVEAFTSVIPNRFHAYPGQMKNQTDWALAFGVTNFIFHTFQHQPLGDQALPGMAMGPHGSNWHRHQNWWDMLPAYHSYISRASFMLQQGVTVSDILYLTPEGVPHIFWPPEDAMSGNGLLKDKRGYGFDAASPRILIDRATVEDGHIVFKDASRYKIMVLPKSDTMTPETLQKIIKFVENGAIIIGNPPFKSPSLVDYPNSDKKVVELSTKLWGGLDIPLSLTKRTYGQGSIYWGQNIYEKDENEEEFYPSYFNTANLLREIGIEEDLSVDGGPVRFTHRKTSDQDIYFVANTSDKAIDVKAKFRVTNLSPELWHPETGERRNLPEFNDNGKNITIPLKFEPNESYFVVFEKAKTNMPSYNINFPTYKTLKTINGPWSVTFDPKRGGPNQISFNTLLDWKDHPEKGVKYYSGTATYKKTFDLPIQADPNGNYMIELGEVYEMANVNLNGHDLGIVWTSPWRISAGNILKDKGNVLIVEVANSWENRLIGDSFDEDKDVRTLKWSSGLLEGKDYKSGRYTFTTYLNEASDFGDIKQEPYELQPSGLIGPVKILKVNEDIE
tara:strand:+ start:5025 stop:8135 length:3111 start_codon:yes stop_codon:yes gene_type:complete